MSFGLRHPFRDAADEDLSLVHEGIKNTIRNAPNGTSLAAAGNEGLNEGRSFPASYPVIVTRAEIGRTEARKGEEGSKMIIVKARSGSVDLKFG